MLANLYKEHQQNQSETRRQAGASASPIAPPSPAPPSADRSRGLLRAENRRQEVLRAIPAVTDRLVSEVNEHVQSIFVRPRPSPRFRSRAADDCAGLTNRPRTPSQGNQQLIEREVRSLKDESQRFTKQTQAWMTAVDDFKNEVNVRARQLLCAAIRMLEGRELKGMTVCVRSCWAFSRTTRRRSRARCGRWCVASEPS